VVPGHRVLLLDDINGWWPASGTALHLAQQRHQVTVITPSEQAAAAQNYSGTGTTTRERFAKFGVEVLLAKGLEAWRGNTATIVDLFTGDREEREFDTLVMALTNTPEDGLTRALAGSGKEVHTLGDAVSARTAAMALYEARKLALAI
jgi:NAD(P)H-nitrite reductase large subunit